MITLRDATTEDIPLLQQLSRTIWHQVFPTIITREQIETMLGKMYATDTIINELSRGVVWRIILEDNIPIGYVSYSMISPDECKLHKVYVQPDHHSKGIGKRCLAEAADFARAHHAQTLVLMVNRTNAKALRAYKAFGFEVAESLDWEFSPGFILHDYKMALRL